MLITLQDIILKNVFLLLYETLRWHVLVLKKVVCNMQLLLCDMRISPFSEKMLL